VLSGKKMVGRGTFSSMISCTDLVDPIVATPAVTLASDTENILFPSYAVSYMLEILNDYNTLMSL
jgi:hypothetical protein